MQLVNLGGGHVTLQASGRPDLLAPGPEISGGCPLALTVCHPHDCKNRHEISLADYGLLSSQSSAEDASRGKRP